MLSALGRIIVVAFALFAAAAAAIVIAFRIGLEWMTVANHGRDPVLGVLDALFQFVMAVLALHSLMAVPLLIVLGVVVTGEVARIRSALFYVAGGGGAAAAIPLLIKETALNWPVFATAGFVGGAVYWLLAGRRA